MLAKLRPRSAYDVMAAIACFGVLAGGTAYAANEWTGANIVDESLTGADVKGKAATSTVAAVNGSLTGNDISGQPANAALGQPFVNGTLSSYDIADNTLTGADVNEATLGKVPAATNADKLGGVAAKPVVHPVAAAAGDHDRCVETPPATGTFCSENFGEEGIFPWENLGGGWASAAYFKDAFGIVHIEGVIRAYGSLPARIFILPAGYRPAAGHIFIVTGRVAGFSDADESNGRVDVSSNGDVFMSVAPYHGMGSGDIAHLSLDGINFRAA